MVQSGSEVSSLGRSRWLRFGAAEDYRHRCKTDLLNRFYSLSKITPRTSSSNRLYCFQMTSFLVFFLSVVSEALTEFSGANQAAIHAVRVAPWNVKTGAEELHFRAAKVQHVSRQTSFSAQPEAAGLCDSANYLKSFAIRILRHSSASISRSESVTEPRNGLRVRTR